MSTEGGWLSTSTATLFFEDNPVGRLKREVWEASEDAIDATLAEYGLPSPSELGKPGTYIQNTVRHELIEPGRPSTTAPTPTTTRACPGPSCWKRRSSNGP